MTTFHCIGIVVGALAALTVTFTAGAVYMAVRVLRAAAAVAKGIDW